VFLIFGTDLSEKVVNVVSFVCGFCGADAKQDVIKSSTRFTLFFIPLFSFGTRYRNQCTNCGAEAALTAVQARNSLQWSASH
jgi:hypothetical protein